MEDWNPDLYWTHKADYAERIGKLVPGLHEREEMKNAFTNYLVDLLDKLELEGY